ncbi:MAG TPA: beta-ketoacyl synthase N-terminal-like domain-containing protein [Micromonosporaceae bacterium]|nr:beta-ketoacyl synthase N-terminal-like domain-containing protein [Micromonosporaceae bacterium]
MSEGQLTGQLTPLQRALLGIRELRAQLDEVEHARTEPIAVIGIGCRLPGGANDPESFWRLLHDGVDAIRDMPEERWDVDAYFDPDPEAPGKMSTRWGGFLSGIEQFDPAFFGISPWEAANMDPQQRLMLEVAQEAFDDAGQVRAQLRGSRTGVFIGLAHSEYGWLNLNNPELSNVYTATGSFGSIVANRVSYLYDLRGPSYTMDAVCSSSLLAVHQACESLRSGDCTMALAGGAGLFLKPEGFVWFTKLGVMAPDGRCKAFDASGDGIVLGEGVAAVVLKTLSRAQRDGDPVYAVLRGSAVVQDGRSNGLTAPSRLSQEAMLREAYRRSGVDPQAVQYVEAHGTGTILGDPIEAQALGTVLGKGRDSDRPLMIGSVKTNIGHLQMVGGLAGLIKVIMAMRHRQLPASLHFKQANPHIPFDDYRLRVQDRRSRWPYQGPLLAGVTSLSFGGTNVHVIVEEAPASPPEADRPAPADGRARLLPLSAHSPASLRDLAAAYQELASGPAELDLDDLCYTASLRRNHYDDRLAVTFTSREELAERLAAFQEQEARPGLSWGDKAQHARRRLAFVLPGQGGQWAGMGRRLLTEEPVFRQAVEACAAAMQPHVSWSLLDELQADGPQSRLDELDVVQPVTWAVQVALAELWRSWGVVPDAVVGHSMGEVAAACVAGALSLDDAAAVICRRSRLVRRIQGQGTMAVVELPLDEARAAIAGYEDQLAVAVSNSPTSTVLSGGTGAIEAVLAALGERDVFCRRVNVEFASHSPQVDVLHDDLLEALREVRPREAAVPIYSTVTGQPVDGRELTAGYWARNLREPVLFSTAVRQLVEAGHTLFIEISPHPILLPAVEQGAQHIDTPVVALPSLRRDEDERSVLLGTYGRLYTAGQRVDWRRLHPSDRTVLRLPRYPWQRQRCWLDFPPAGAAAVHSGPQPQAGSGRYFQAATAGGEHFWEVPVAGGRLPEAGYVDLVLAAGTALLGTAACVLTEVTLGEPLELPAGGGVAQVVLGSLRHGSADWQVLSRPGTAAAGGAAAGGAAGGVAAAGGAAGWTSRARGTLRTAPGTSQPYLLPQEAPDAVRERCTSEVPGTAYHQSRAAAGLADGAAAGTVQRLWRRDGELLALLQAPASPTGRRSPVDWTLLHSAFGLLAVTVPSEADAAAGYRPTAVERLRVFRPASGDLWAHARLREIGEGSLGGDVRLLDAELRVVAEASGVRLRLPGTGSGAADAGAVAGSAGAPAEPTSRSALHAVEPGQRRAVLTGYLREQIAAVLGLPAAQLGLDQPLAGLGLNSLMIFELRNRLKVMYGTQIAAEEFLAGISVATIVDQVLAQLGTAGPEPAPAPRQPAVADRPARPAPGRTAAAVSAEAADWLVRGRPDAGARMRLFCLPYAGGNASTFRAWADELPAEVEVCPIQLPGREQRHKEPPFTQMSALVTTLAQVLSPYLDLPFALFGHSMGALASFELARQLRREGLAGPAHLYVSAMRAPQLPDLEPPLHRLPEPRLVAKLREINGTPEEMLADPETLGLYLPAVRADLALVETLVHQTEPPLSCPLTVFGGAQDDKVPEEALAAWRSQTEGSFTLQLLPGDHFFIQQRRTELLAALGQHLTDDLRQLDEDRDED